MSTNLSQLPFELILKICQYLEFSDIWYLGNCSHPLRKLCYNVLQQHYNIDLIGPRIINPLNNLVHAAVAYLGRHGIEHNSIQPHVLQSVANHLTMEIYDRLPYATDRVASLDFILNNTLSVLLDHCLSFPTTLPPDNSHNTETTEIPSTTITHVPLDSATQDPNAETPQTGLLMVDFLVALYQTLSVLFDAEQADEIHHRLLIAHLHRLLDVIKKRYHALFSYSRNTPQLDIKRTSHWNDLKSVTRVICALLKCDLVSATDVEDITLGHINRFFWTQPSDVTFTEQDGLKFMPRNPNGSLMLAKSVTKHESPAFYNQLSLWLQEANLRLRVTMEIFRSILAKPGVSLLDSRQLSLLLREASAAVLLSETVPEQENNTTQIDHTTTPM